MSESLPERHSAFQNGHGAAQGPRGQCRTRSLADARCACAGQGSGGPPGRGPRNNPCLLYICILLESATSARKANFQIGPGQRPVSNGAGHISARASRAQARRRRLEPAPQAHLEPQRTTGRSTRTGFSRRAIRNSRTRTRPNRSISIL